MTECAFDLASIAITLIVGMLIPVLGFLVWYHWPIREDRSNDAAVFARQQRARRAREAREMEQQAVENYPQ